MELKPSYIFANMYIRIHVPQQFYPSPMLKDTILGISLYELNLGPSCGALWGSYALERHVHNVSIADSGQE